MQVVRASELPVSATAHELVGEDHGGVGVCVILVDAPPGGGPSLHRRDYDEIDIHLNPRYVSEWPA